MTGKLDGQESTGSDIKKLKILLPYWINHNNQHILDNEKWLGKAEKLGLSEVAGELRKAVEIAKNANRHLELAVRELEKERRTDEEIPSQSHEVPIAKDWKPGSFEFSQIGIIRTPYTDNAPYQPVEEEEGDFRIIVDPAYADGLKKLEGFRYIYVLSYIDRVKKGSSVIVNPPWTGDLEVGTFASRSPVRPNPIGLSIVGVRKIVNNEIFTSGLDVFDNTPLLDIKPYIKDLDTKADANYGWIEEIDDFDHLSLHIKGIPHDY
ncbi:MAG: tRNA (N6-threonylcarbamoyladenosine(37)-N6)-methyltransferase TrmO [Methanosarcinaceae archaeon]|nr:tRNA (N6-threonylcarbamoyladenosine(37)-N6)-methyltransferase TrmO [Methanosarcinaceae archaeon]